VKTEKKNIIENSKRQIKMPISAFLFDAYRKQAAMWLIHQGNDLHSYSFILMLTPDLNFIVKFL